MGRKEKGESLTHLCMSLDLVLSDVVLRRDPKVSSNGSRLGKDAKRARKEVALGLGELGVEAIERKECVSS
jgi:hypothetical protein